MLDSAHHSPLWRRLDTMRNVILGILLAGVVWVYVVPTAQSFYVASLPASRWLEIKSIIVEDTTDGVPPVAHVELTVHRPFPADWSVAVQSELDGIITLLCDREGDGIVLAGASMPNLGDTTWWIGPTRDKSCPKAGPGEYRMVVTVTMFPLSAHPKLVRGESDLFRIVAMN